MSDTDNTRPIAPKQPDLDDCCGRGCFPCIFDTYDDAMERYRRALKVWEKENSKKAKSGGP